MVTDNADLCDRYSAIYTGVVADSLDELGYEHQTLPSGINPLTHDMWMSGLAFPVRGQPDPNADFESNVRRFLQMLGEAPEHSIIAYETNDTESAHLGELSTRALDERGCRGAVVDGGTRDIQYILDQEFPVFTRYRTPADAPPRWRLEDWGVPIHIGSVEIRPGDMLVGDADGVVCVPKPVTTEIIEMAENMANSEDKVREVVSEGATPIEAYEQYGEF